MDAPKKKKYMEPETPKDLMKNCCTKCIGYIRVSTGKQANEGISLEAQEQTIRKWADINGYELLNIYRDEGISGKSIRNRKGLQEALSRLDRETILVCYSLSRLSRSISDALKISEIISQKESNFSVIKENIDTSTVGGRLVFHIMAALAEFEREQTVERTKEAMREMKAQGRANGRPPYGYRIRGEKGSGLEEVPEEQEMIKFIVRLREQENYSYTKISSYLNAKYRPPGGSKKWYPNTIRRILERHKRGVNVKGRKDERF